VCHFKHSIYLILLSFGVMPRVLTALHLPIAPIYNITRQIGICNDTYKFVAYPCSILKEFTVDNKVKVTSHLETVRKLHIWRIDSQ